MDTPAYTTLKEAIQIVLETANDAMTTSEVVDSLNELTGYKYQRGSVTNAIKSLWAEGKVDLTDDQGQPYKHIKGSRPAHLLASWLPIENRPQTTNKLARKMKNGHTSTSADKAPGVSLTTIPQNIHIDVHVYLHIGGNKNV